MKTPWAEMLRRAAAAGVAPEAFWRLSLKEWRMLTGSGDGPTAMDRRELEQLAEAWPDE